MAGPRGLDGDLRRLQIADFAHHDDVWILPEDRPQAAGKRQLDLWVHLDLTDAVQLVFDRIFDRDDVLVAGIDLRQAGVQRRRFSAAGRTGRQNDAVALLDQPVDHLVLHAGEAQFLEMKHGGGLIEQAHHHPLTEGSRYDRHADVDVFAGEADADAPILRQAFLGDIEPGHDLDARNDDRLKALRR